MLLFPWVGAKELIGYNFKVQDDETWVGFRGGLRLFFVLGKRTAGVGVSDCFEKCSDSFM